MSLVVSSDSEMGRPCQTFTEGVTEGVARIVGDWSQTSAVSVGTAPATSARWALCRGLSSLELKRSVKTGIRPKGETYCV